MYVCMYVYVLMCMYVCIYVCVCIDVYVCIYVCVCIEHVYVFMYVCMYVFMYVYVYACNQPEADLSFKEGKTGKGHCSVCTYIHTYIHICTYMHAYIFMYTYTHEYLRLRLQVMLQPRASRKGWKRPLQVET